MSASVYDLQSEHLIATHALNQHFATELSSLTFQQFGALFDASVYARVAGNLDGFLLAFDQDTQGDGENLNWLKTRLPHFLYVDRLAVAPHAQGRGIARCLYRDLVAWAAQRGYPLIACEVNIRPPNPASDALHASVGFVEIGQQELKNGKRVRYLARRLQPLEANP